LLPEGLAAALILVTMEVMPVDLVGGAIFFSNKCFSYQIGNESRRRSPSEDCWVELHNEIEGKEK